MTSPPPPPLDGLLPTGWPYPFEPVRRDTGGPTRTYRCAVPWSPVSYAQRSEPLFDLLLALVRAGLGPAADWTLDPATPGQVTVTIAARALATAACHRPYYDLFTDSSGSIATGVPAGEQWLTLEWPSTADEPPASEPVEPVARLLAGAIFGGLQVGHLVALLGHAVCDTCHHSPLPGAIRHRQPLHTSSTDESPEMGCRWPCGHQVLPAEPRCYCSPRFGEPVEDADPPRPAGDGFSPEWTV